MKNKYRNRLNVEPDLSLKLSSFDPDMRKLTSEKPPAIALGEF
jgi:hypothetical protein